MPPLPLWGSPIRVNTTAGQGQAVPDIAVLPGGHFAIIWADTQAERPNKTDYWLSYRLQTFDALGNPVGNEVLIETLPNNLPITGVGTNGSTNRPAVTGLNDGGLVVAFPTFASNYTVSGIQIQFRNADGTIRASHQASQGSAGSLGGNVELAALDTGETVVTWVDASGVKARLYDATGAALGNEITIAPVGATQSIVELTSLAGGRVALVWGDGPGGLAPTKLYGAIMDRDGTVVAPAFAIDQDRGQAFSWGDNPSVTELSNGNIVAAWSSSDSSGWYITTRIFNSSGVPLGEEHRAIGGNGEGPSIAALPSGGYILVWQTSYRVFDQNGAPVGDEFRFTDLRGSGGLFLYGETDVQVLTDGRVVITWTGAGDIYAQIVDPRTEGVALNGTASDDQLVGSEYADMLVGEAGHDQLFGMSGNDNIYGGAGDDFLYGGVGDDNLDGGAGADTFDGWVGFDIVFYSQSTSGITADLGNIVAGTGDAAGDTFSYIDGIWGSSYDDRFYGDQWGNALYGRDGADFLYGREGNDQLYGGDGNDTLDGGAGADVLDGGLGFDFVSYSQATAAVTADLGNIVAGKGEAAGDTFNYVDGIWGSAHDDLFFGDQWSNVLYGQDGSDNLYGRGGNDQLYGGNGDDLMEGGTGADVLDGGLGFDTVSYTQASTGVRADLAGTLSGLGDAAGDTFVSVENVIGSQFGDDLYGDQGNNTLVGGAGNDWLSGRDGNDSLYGGAGIDVFVVAPNNGWDIIFDFQDNIDKIDLRAWGFASISQAVSYIADTGPDLRFDFSDGSHLTVLNVANFTDLANDILIA